MKIEPLMAGALAFLVVFLASVPGLNVRLRWPLAFLALVLYIRYIVWRGLFTLELAFPHALVSIPLFLAEVYCLGQFLLFLFQVQRPTNPKATLDGLSSFPTVDIFVTACREPTEVLCRTAVACLTIQYPKKRVYILDDGRSQEVKRLALRLGCHYLTRSTNEHAKAGNVNAALQRTSGELVAIFDCDHAPVRSFLQETVGFFRDSKVAFVQTVQHFYNPDPFQRNLFHRSVLNNEQELFFRAIMPGRNRYNAAFWTGTGALIRRSALEEIGGVLTDTLTEDFRTSLELHARGWRSVHLNRVLSVGLAPEGYGAYLTQRLRWTQGIFQTWWKAKPLVCKGLSMGQRVCYFSSIYYFLFAPARLLLLSAPLAFLLFGAIPLRATPLEIATYFLPQFIALYVVFPLIAEGRRCTLVSEVYETATCFFQAPLALKAFLFPRGKVFRVTPKGLEYLRPQFHWVLALPQLGLLFMLALGVSLGFWRLLNGLDPLQRDATVINMAWASYNALLAAAAVAIAREQPQQRRAYPIAHRLPCEVSGEHGTVSGKTVHISESGARVQVAGDLYFSELLALRLYGRSGEVLQLPCRVVGAEKTKGLQLLDFRFVGLTFQQEEALIEFLFSPPWAWEEGPLAMPQPWSTLAFLFIAPYKALRPFRPQKRPPLRFCLPLPAVVWLGTRCASGETRAIGPEELEIQMAGPWDLGRGTVLKAAVLIGGEWLRLTGEVTGVAKEESGTRVRMSLRLPIGENYLLKQRLQALGTKAHSAAAAQ